MCPASSLRKTGAWSHGLCLGDGQSGRIGSTLREVRVGGD